MYKIFFNNRTVILTDTIQKYYNLTEVLFYKYTNKADLLSTIISYEKNIDNTVSLVIYADDLNELKFNFKSCFINTGAGGGLVRTKGNKFLIIKKRGKYDLPKGKINKGENYRQAALREVSEETGLSKLKIIKYLTSTYHTYKVDNLFFLKKTYWYEMYNLLPHEPLKPEAIEQITEAHWMNKTQITSILNNTYPSIIEVLKKARVLKNY